MKNKNQLIYRIVTGLFSALMVFSASMYFAQYESVSKTFLQLGFPTFVIYPLALAKILGLVAIWTRKSRMLAEWAYAGFVFDLLLAAGAHINAGDGDAMGALVGLVLVGVSYVYYRKLYTKEESLA